MITPEQREHAKKYMKDNLPNFWAVSSILKTNMIELMAKYAKEQTGNSKPLEKGKDLYTSEEILAAPDLYELQHRFCCLGLTFQYQMTESEMDYVAHIKGAYRISDWILRNSNSTGLITFNRVEDVKGCLQSDGNPNKAVMLSDDTALQKLFFWLS